MPVILDKALRQPGKAALDMTTPELDPIVQMDVVAAVNYLMWKGQMDRRVEYDFVFEADQAHHNPRWKVRFWARDAKDPSKILWVLKNDPIDVIVSAGNLKLIRGLSDQI